MTKCPCLSDKKYEECCLPYHDETKRPDTAEALMRARYCAFVMNKVEFIRDSHLPETTDFDFDSAKKWAETSTWKGLEIIATQKGLVEDQEGIVEFKALYTDDQDNEYSHHERSMFVKKDEAWFYKEGQILAQGPYKRAEPKIGRNMPCPCGSGKKHKKCCLG